MLKFQIIKKGWDMYNKTFSAKNRGIRKGQVEFIVLHDTAGSGTAADTQYLAHDPENRHISVDFCILKDGTIYQLNQDLTGHCTYHAGRHTKFRSYTNGGVNQHSVGIEISQKANMQGLSPAYPFAQVEAVALTCIDLCKRFNLTKNDITTHQQIITDGSRTDPRNFPWTQFWAIFNSHTDDAHPDTENLSLTVKHIVVEGDTLSSVANEYHTNIETIKALNNLENVNLISVGQILIIRR